MIVLMMALTTFFAYPFLSGSDRKQVAPLATQMDEEEDLEAEDEDEPVMMEDEDDEVSDLQLGNETQAIRNKASDSQIGVENQRIKESASDSQLSQEDLEEEY
jgi:hypothetical protein